MTKLFLKEFKKECLKNKRHSKLVQCLKLMKICQKHYPLEYNFDYDPVEFYCIKKYGLRGEQIYKAALKKAGDKYDRRDD